MHHPEENEKASRKASRKYENDSTSTILHQTLTNQTLGKVQLDGRYAKKQAGKNSP